RFILEGDGAYSVVAGEKHPMNEGDVVLTPGSLWHSHGHDGSAPAYWLDGLDAPLTRFLSHIFFEEHPDHYEKDVRVVQSSPYRFSRDDIARSLDGAKPDPDGFHGPRVVLDTTSMPTVALSMERLDSGAHTRRQRS